MIDLAVIVVTWNVRALVLDALHSLFADLDSSGLDTQVYVVDSASSDGTAQAVAAAFPQVKLIASAENLGFARANNLALEAMGFRRDGQLASVAASLPRAVYLLNPDTITHPGATQTIFDALMALPDAGLVGAQLAYGDGSFQHSAFAFPGLRQLWVEFFPTPGRFIEGAFNGRYPRALYEANIPFLADCVLGATMMLKREVIAQTGMFDEAFFMYCEEIDWAWRIREAGWRVYCVPAARVTHLGGQSSGQARPTSIVNLWTSRMRLYRKHHPLWKNVIARAMLSVGMKLKMHQASRLQSAEGDSLLAAYRAVQTMATDF